MTNLLISKLDYQRLKQRIIQAQTGSKLSPVQLMKLLRNVDAATLLDPTKMPPDVVTMHSVVSVEYVESGKQIVIRLVYPEEADGAQNQISIFAPLATALLGNKPGTLTSLPTPFGSVKVRIKQILYQPQAAGDFSL